MSNTLTNKVAIVTGGSRDIGRQVAIKLAAQGASVCVNYFDNKVFADETIKLITDAGGNAFACYADVTKQDDVQKLVAACTEKYGNVLFDHFYKNPSVV